VFTSRWRCGIVGFRNKELESIMTVKKPETREKMLAYIRQHGFTSARQRFGHEYVMNLTHPEPTPHIIHVEQGPEYQGETYIWCECLAGKENLTQGGSPDTPDGALFEGTGVTGLLEFFSEHTPGTSIEDVSVSSLHVGCSFPKRDDVKAASDTCQRTADSAVEQADGVLSYRCPEHRSRIDASRRGNTLWSVPRTIEIGKIHKP
jgi:hypothetical protein